MAFGKGKARKIVPIEADSRVGDVIEAWPETLATLLDMGFEPLRNPIARKTVARLFTVRQAAAFKGVDLDDLLFRLRVAVGQEQAGSRLAAAASRAPEPRRGLPIAGGAEPAAPGACCGPGETDVPELEGDVRVVGMVPCPVRGLLVEAFDKFAGGLSVASGKRIAWWLAGEGTGIGDARNWLEGIALRREPERLPDVLALVGTELWCYPRYGRIARSGVYGPFPAVQQRRPDLAPLEDPEGVLGLLFVALFTLVCHAEHLPGGRLPRSWQDLADPALEGQIAFPSLHLPIVPDLMAVLHAELGEDGFRRFARNLSTTMHPAQAAPRTRRGEIPGIVILPTIFSHGGELAGGVEVVPEEGPVAVPAYAAVRRDAPPEALEVARFLCSEAFLRPGWENGQFLPDHAGIDAPLPRGTALSRPWETLAEMDPGAESQRLLALLEGRAA